MRKGGGGAKGAQFERDICRQLSLWWSNDIRDDIFWRTSQSGGRATTRMKKGKGTANQYGDISATDPIGATLIKFVSIEAKRGYKWDALSLLATRRTVKTNPFFLFTKQARRQAKTANTPWWWLIFKPDQKETMIMMPRRFTGILTFPAEEPWITTERYIIMRLDTFLRSITPDDIRKHAGS